MVDWSLARRIARLAAGSAPVPDLGPNLPTLSAAAVEQVGAYTSLRPPDPAPPPEAVARAAWAEANLETFSNLLDPVAKRLEARTGDAGPLAGPLRGVARAALAAEIGLALGYLSQRVLGQYELSLVGPEAPPRLLFVGPNIAKVATELELDLESFLTWIVLHETTHVLQFSGVPWLRGHLGGLLREYLDTVEVHVEGGATSLLSRLPDPKRLVEAFREGGLIALVQTAEQRGILGRMQSAMAVVEGYSEHVMDAVGAEVVPQYAGLRAAMERRRASRSAPERILQRLLGLDLKLRQYERGKRFCDAVVASAGIAGLNHVWSAPAALPSLTELEAPEAWLARMRTGAALPA